MTSAGLMQDERSGALPQIFGRYLLVSRLSRGGMGEIFLARHGMSGFEKLVVIKKVLPQLSADAEFSRRFIDEAQVAVKLQHANIAQVFEVGRVADEYFLAMEYIEGRDLRRTLSVLGETGRGLPPDLALMVARDVANGLAYAHRRTDPSGESLELVHCDISPPNIMMSFEGETKIIDFGIAKSALRAQATDAKRGFGKYGYMAPEQLIRGRKVDFRTDIYATGVILYEMLTGRRLYDVGDTPDYRALAKMVSKGQHPLPSQIDAKLAGYDELVARALRPNPDDRYPSAAAFRDVLQQALVELNPTISPDQLGAFMRYMFAEEVLEQRRQIDAMDRTELEQFRDEMSAAASTTISFALGEGAPATAVPVEVAAAADRADDPAEPELVQQTMPRPVEPAGDDEAATSARIRIAPETTASVRSSGPGRTVVWLAALAVAAAGIAIAVKLFVLDRRAPEVAVAEPARDPAEVAPAAVAPPIEPTVSPIPPEPAPEPKEAALEQAPPPAKQATPAEEATPAAPRARPPTRARKDKKKPRPAKPEPEQAAPTAADVQSRFRAVKREYNEFKKNYGARLDSEWNDLASLATFGSGPDKLRAIDKEIKRFRGKMQAIRSGG